MANSNLRQMIFSTAVLQAQVIKCCCGQCEKSFPPSYIPFDAVTSITEPDSSGDRVVVGSMSVSNYTRLNEIRMTNSFSRQVFCDPVQMAPGFFVVAYLPTQAERNGDFSSFKAAIVDPASRQPFPGNMIPANRIPGVFAWRIRAIVSSSGRTGP